MHLSVLVCTKHLTYLEVAFLMVSYEKHLTLLMPPAYSGLATPNNGKSGVQGAHPALSGLVQGFGLVLVCCYRGS